MDMYRQQLYQARVWAAPDTVHNGSRSMTYYNHGTWLQWIYAGSLLKTMPETHQGQLLAYPWLRWDWDKCQEQCDLGVQTTGGEWHNRAHPQVNSSRRGILSGFPPIGSAPIPPTLYPRSETQLRNRSLNFYYNNQGVDLTCDSKMTTKEKRGGPTQYIVQVLVKISVMSPI